jgi:RNA polymerase sigma factor (sigma-70 family)
VDESWLQPLSDGETESAWAAFMARYQRLIFSVIRHRTQEPDEVMDVFTGVCEALRARDFARLRRCAARYDPQRRFSTLLVVVVRNAIADWYRQRAGRRRNGDAPVSMSPRQQRIFEYVFVKGRGHAETYELLRSRDGETLSYAEYLRELAATYRLAGALRRRRRADERALRLTAALGEAEPGTGDPAAAAERRAILAAAFDGIPAEHRLAVQLFVVEGMPAADVARVLRLRNAKAVYNRVYRALAAVRARLLEQGLRARDV